MVQRCTWTRTAGVTAGTSALLTRYFSRGSVSNASPNIERQYSAILACCLGLRVSESRREGRDPNRTSGGASARAAGAVGTATRDRCSLTFIIVEFAAVIWNDSRVHVVLKGQDDRKRRGLEGALGYRLDHLLKGRSRRLEMQQKATNTLRKETINVTTGFCNNLLWPPGKYCILHTLVSQQESFQFTV